jgi:hypothetical protein
MRETRIAAMTRVGTRTSGMLEGPVLNAQHPVSPKGTRLAVCLSLCPPLWSAQTVKSIESSFKTFSASPVISGHGAPA